MLSRRLFISSLSCGFHEIYGTYLLLTSYLPLCKAKANLPPNFAYPSTAQPLTLESQNFILTVSSPPLVKDLSYTPQNLPNQKSYPRGVIRVLFSWLKEGKLDSFRV